MKMKIQSKIIEQDGVQRVDFFDEHWYKFTEDKIYPSVSMVIGDVMSKGYGFEQWLRDTGNESKYIVREAANSGSKLHNAIETMLYGEEITAENDDFNKDEWSKLYSWTNWWKERKIEVVKKNEQLMIERIVHSDRLQVAGTVDLIARIDGELYVVDWKTGNAIHDTSELQVAAYASMLNIKKAMIVHVGAKNKARIKEHEVDVEKLSSHFEKVVELFKWRNPKIKAPTTEFPLTLKIND